MANTASHLEYLLAGEIGDATECSEMGALGIENPHSRSGMSPHATIAYGWSCW